jgi:hypothetical protein
MSIDFIWFSFLTSHAPRAWSFLLYITVHRGALLVGLLKAPPPIESKNVPRGLDIRQLPVSK